MCSSDLVASLKSISITVGEQITLEKLTELSIVMRISRYDHVGERSNFKKIPMHTQDHVMHSNEGGV